MTSPNPIDPADIDAAETANLTALHDMATRLHQAVARAEVIAGQTEVAREVAERSHASKVADLLMEGSSTIPAKPAALSAAQASDDAADAALDMLRRRELEADAAWRNAVHVAGHRRLSALIAAQGVEGHKALSDLAAAARRLIVAVGPNRASLLVEEVVTNLTDAPAHEHAARLSDIRALYASIDAGAHVDALRPDMEIGAGWPNRADAVAAARAR